MLAAPQPFDTSAWLATAVPARPPGNAGHATGAPALAWCLAQQEQRHGPLPGPGGRNTWLTSLTTLCNKRGVPEAALLAHAQQWQADDFPAQEVQATIRGIYTRYASQHASEPFARAAPTSLPPAAPLAPAADLSAPLPEALPPAVYDALPGWLRRCCTPFTPGAERDVMLLSTLAVLSGCFPTVTGLYDGAPVWLNLFTFVLAPAASGKGAMSWARKLAWPWHQQLTAASRQAAAAYDLQVQAQKTRGKGTASPAEAPPTPPAFRQLYLPGNTSAAALLRALADNEGRGIICETESDTLSGALGQDFGNFSDLLRKAFHHEPVSLMRKTDREQIELAAPAISLALTGTPAQLRRLIPSAEDGLFSRFLFYTFERPASWRDVGPGGGRGQLGSFFDEQAAAVSRMMHAVAAQPIRLELTAAGWAQLNAAGRAGLAEALALAGGAGASSALRLGLTTYRIAGILAVLRSFEYGLAPGACLLAADQEVHTAIAIVHTCRAHALHLLGTLPAERGLARPPSHAAQKAANQAHARQLHQAGQSMREIAAVLGISKSTVSNWTTAQALSS